MKTAIHPTRKENFPKWYQQVIAHAELADNAFVRGGMVIRPWGYAIWENIQRELDLKIKATGHLNAYFPLLIPLSLLQKQGMNMEGGLTGCAVVTHHRLGKNPAGELTPAGEEEEPLIIRPTSEAVIGASLSRWVQSYRDLPIMLNQWANVVRWERSPRQFLRTSEFLWQEGHTVHATSEEARDETLNMLDLYRDFVVNFLAIPVIKGLKCSWERFPGAVSTYTIEAMMQDGRALQAGAAHFFGQNIAAVSDISFINTEGNKEFGWTTSCKVSTRLIGAMVMVHGDDDGIVLPPFVAPVQIIIIPLVRRNEDAQRINAYCEHLQKQMSRKKSQGQYLRVSVDNRAISVEEKRGYHIKRGIPVRIEIGKKDIDQRCVSYVCRNDRKNLWKVETETFISDISKILKKMHLSMLHRAEKMLSKNTLTVTTLEEFKASFDRPDGRNTFVLAPFIDNNDVQSCLHEMGVTVRCIPLEPVAVQGEAICIFTGKSTANWAIYAKSY